MRIIQLASGDLWAGAEVQLFYLANSLNNQNEIELLVVLLNHGQLEQELINNGVNVIVLDENKLNGFQIILELYKVVGKYNPDLIHTHRIKENIVGAVVARISSCKCIRTVHGDDEFQNASFSFIRKIYSLLDKFVAFFMQQRIIAVSDELGRKLANKFPPSKLVVINNSIDINAISVRSSEKTDFSAKQNTYNVCFIGRFVPVKRIDLFYIIAKETIKNNSNIQFHMIGDGPLWNGLHKRVCDDQLVSNIHLTGFVKNTAPYLKQMDLLVFTSDHEGLPMTLLEAMALGVAVLTRDNLPTIKQVLCNGKCGYIELSSDNSGFSKRLIEILEDESTRKKKYKMAQEVVSELYSIDSNVQTYTKLYVNVLGV